MRRLLDKMIGKWRNIGLWPFNRRPSCDWVTDRQLAYVTCDPVLSDREYAAIDTHLASCPRCAEEFNAVSDEWETLAEVLYPLESLPPIDCHAMAARIITAVHEHEVAAAQAPPTLGNLHRDCGIRRRRESGCSQPPGSHSPQVVLTAQDDRSCCAPFRGMPDICEPKLAPLQTPKSARRSCPAVAAAVAAIFIIAVPVMAYVGQRVWLQVCQTLNNPADTQLVSQHVSDPSGPSDQSNAPASPDATTALPDAGSCRPSQLDTNLFSAVDRQAQQCAIQAEIEATLPHTDAEYEAWARHEYPHIMALYDILTGKGLPREGEILDGEAFRKRVAALIRNNLPEDVRAYLIETADRVARSDHPLWDGRPVNIPDWAQRLYADTPEPNRPTAWRALLIYSGEIFKLDWPKTTQEPNVRPTLDGLMNAAFTVGCTTSPDATFGDLTHLDVPSNYLNTLAVNTPLADDVLIYIATSSRLIATTEFRKLAAATTSVRAALRDTRNSECAFYTRLLYLSALLDSRGNVLEPRPKASLPYTWSK